MENDFPILRLIIICFATVLLTKYFFYMAIAPWFEVWKTRQEELYLKKTPKVSVIIPAYNEEVGLLHTVKTILKSQYKHLEVIVVNDGSTDDSDAIMRDFVKRYNRRRRIDSMGVPKIALRYFYKANGGKGNALNYGIKRSTGDIIMSIDADCIVAQETVGNFVKYFNNPNVMAAIGNIRIGNTETILGIVQYLEFLLSFYFKKAELLLGLIYIIGGAGGAFRKEVFEKIGYYNHKNITEDIDLSVRIQDAGMKIVYASDAIVYTEGASSLTGLFKQRLRWKRGRFQTFGEHSHLFFSLKRRHNKLLTCLMFPLAIIGDIQLLCELPFLVFLYIYSYLTNDFSSFISGMIVVSSMFIVQIFFDKSPKRIGLFLLMPIGWLLFYVSTIVEFSALYKSLWGMIKKQAPTWQQWNRVGLQTREIQAVSNK